MDAIEHRHRLEGIDGRIDPQGSEWQANGQHLVFWRAEGVDDPAAAAARLRQAKDATLDYLARRGTAEEAAEEVVERDRVEIVEVRLEEGGLQAVLRVIGKD